MLVPFLIFAIGISHGVQKINGIALQSSDAENALTAARRTFRQLFLPGMIAILADAVGFITLLIIDIGVIRELAIGASIGVAVIVFTNLILLPVAISYAGISKRAVSRSKQDAVSEHPFWRLLSGFASAKVAPVSIVLALLAFGGGLWYSQNLKIGDLDQGAPELRPDSRYNQDNSFIINHYSTSSDVLVVMVKTPREGCSAYPTMSAINELTWKMENTPGVQSAISLVTVSKQVIKGMNEGNLKWEALSRNKDVLNSSIARADGLYNNDCSLAPLLVFLNDHKAETLDRAVHAVQEFAAENNREGLEFLLAAGNAGIEAATNEVIKRSELTILILVYICVAAMCMITFRSWAATLCIVLPLVLTSVLGNALMAFMGIGVKVATLPVVALGVGIGVDYGIYIYSRLESFLRAGLPLQEAYYEPAVAALAAQHATDEEIASIGEAYQRMEAAPNPEALLQPDLDFHSRIADATHNDLLAHLCNMLSLALREALKHSNQRPNLHELALPRHKAILTAIENRDALGARHATLVQLDDARNALSVVLGRELGL
jgi:predicted RND superfamily exporter protein